MLGDLFKGVGSIIGSAVGVVTGTVAGVTVPVIAATLGMTEEMVKKALEAGCVTYEEIRKFLLMNAIYSELLALYLFSIMACYILMILHHGLMKVYQPKQVDGYYWKKDLPKALLFCLVPVLNTYLIFRIIFNLVTHNYKEDEKRKEDENQRNKDL